MAHHDIVAIGASAGGLSALKRVVAGLPAGLDAAVLVVQHLSSDRRSDLPAILGRAGQLPAGFAEDGAPATRGRIHVAPPDRHLMLLQDGILRLSRAAWENGARPSIDTLFRSAAVCCGPRSIGVVLTGYLDDGSAGLRALRRCGAVTVVQDPADAEYPDMPRSALEATEVDHVAALEALPALLARLVGTPAGPPQPVPPDIQLEADIMTKPFEDDMAALDKLGQPLGLHLSRLRRRDMGAAGWRHPALSLPPRPCLLIRVLRPRHVRGSGASHGDCSAHAGGARPHASPPQPAGDAEGAFQVGPAVVGAGGGVRRAGRDHACGAAADPRDREFELRPG